MAPTRVLYISGSIGLGHAGRALIYDFVGMDATTGSPLERLIAYRINWLWNRTHAKSRYDPRDPRP